MDFKDIINNLFYTPAENWFYSRIPDTQTPGNEPQVQLLANQHYLRIDLKSLNIVNRRKFTSTYYGMVNSFIKVPMNDGSNMEFNVATTPSQLQNLDGRHVDRIINIDIPLLGQAPYRGADIQLQLGLFSIKAGELTEPLVSLFTDMSKTAGVSFVASALPYAKYLSKSIGILTGTDNKAELEIGLSTTLSVVNTGYYAIIRAGSGDIDVADLTVNEHDYQLYHYGKPLKGVPYLVFKISCSDLRSNWFQIPEISKTYLTLQSAVREQRFTDAPKSLQAFKFAILTSIDLLDKDGSRIIKEVEDKTNSILNMSQTGLNRDFRSGEKRTELKTDMPALSLELPDLEHIITI